MLLMEEPLGAPDVMARDVMNLELPRIWVQRRKTAPFVKRCIDEAVLLADRVVNMSSCRGRIIEEVPGKPPRPRKLEDRFSPLFGAAGNRARACIYGRRSAALERKTNHTHREVTP